MAHSTGTSNDSRRRPRSSGLQLPDMRQGRPQMSISGPAAMDQSSSPPVLPGVVPPGAVPHPPTGSSSAVSAAPAPYVRRREEALLRAPSRRNQQHLHPQKLNGALWFGVDPEVHAFMRATWQGNFWGPWAKWTDVPPEKQNQWWHAFIQHYFWEDQFHDEIYIKWKKQTQVTVCGRISQDRRDNRHPVYINDTDWASIIERYSTEKAKKKSRSAAASRTSAPTGKKMHKHGAGPCCFVNIEHKMVLEVEQAVEEMLQEGSLDGDSQADSTAATSSKRLLLNQEYIKRGQTKKGTIYGLGSVQYKNACPSMPIPVSLQRNLDQEKRMTSFETTISEIKEDINAFKTEMREGMSAFKTEMREGMSGNSATLNIILQTLQSQASTRTASTEQPFQPQAQSQPQGQPQAQPHLMTNNQSELDRWCEKELGL
ncbi:hypothetical protein Bca4012_040413 [Brassica carinata]